LAAICNKIMMNILSESSVVCFNNALIICRSTVCNTH
jgi:hypothetical protein